MSDRRPASDVAASTCRAAACPPPETTVDVASTTVDVASTTVDVEWDAGDLGCGELVLELRMRMIAMRPGQVLRLIAHDPGAPQDMPAWCRMTGHTLVSHQPPTYLIRKR